MQQQVLDHEEIEWQLEAVDLALVENWLEKHPSGAGLAVVPATGSELTDVYYDTEDWRFYRAGYAMRVRNTDDQSAEATMKALAPAEGGLRRRREISEPIEGAKTLKGIPGSVNASEHSPAPQICARSSRFARRWGSGPEGRPGLEICFVPYAAHQRDPDCCPDNCDHPLTPEGGRGFRLGWSLWRQAHQWWPSALTRQPVRPSVTLPGATAPLAADNRSAQALPM